VVWEELEVVIQVKVDLEAAEDLIPTMEAVAVVDIREAVAVVDTGKAVVEGEDPSLQTPMEPFFRESILSMVRLLSLTYQMVETLAYQLTNPYLIIDCVQPFLEICC
jgi:hypothetical protein